MSPLAFLAIVIAITAVGVAVVVLKNRTSSSDAAKVDEFKREMDALSPRRGDTAEKRD
ncbi:MAG TPA: hypothetical protein VEA78_05115 [Acidimicrobiales bacterium]|nr:hypothetical protein [Acidimicrobiales bacterium]